jgi:hypothetical protein
MRAGHNRENRTMKGEENKNLVNVILDVSDET